MSRQVACIFKNYARAYSEVIQDVKETETAWNRDLSDLYVDNNTAGEGTSSDPPRASLVAAKVRLSFSGNIVTSELTEVLQPAEEPETASNADSSDSYVNVDTVSEEASSVDSSRASPVVAEVCFSFSVRYPNT